MKKLTFIITVIILAAVKTSTAQFYTANTNIINNSNTVAYMQL